MLSIKPVAVSTVTAHCHYPTITTSILLHHINATQDCVGKTANAPQVAGECLFTSTIVTRLYCSFSDA